MAKVVLLTDELQTTTVLLTDHPWSSRTSGWYSNTGQNYLRLQPSQKMVWIDSQQTNYRCVGPIPHFSARTLLFGAFPCDFGCWQTLPSYKGQFQCNWQCRIFEVSSNVISKIHTVGWVTACCSPVSGVTLQGFHSCQTQPVQLPVLGVLVHWRVLAEWSNLEWGKPPIISQQNVVCSFKWDLCDVDYVGFTSRHLHQRVEEHKQSVICNHVREQHGNEPYVKS